MMEGACGDGRSATKHCEGSPALHLLLVIALVTLGWPPVLLPCPCFAQKMRVGGVTISTSLSRMAGSAVEMVAADGPRSHRLDLVTSVRARRSALTAHWVAAQQTHHQAGLTDPSEPLLLSG